MAVKEKSIALNKKVWLVAKEQFGRLGNQLVKEGEPNIQNGEDVIY